eukprot:364904-Chlamydomonas_euryale.AAC.5
MSARTLPLPSNLLRVAVVLLNHSAKARDFGWQESKHGNVWTSFESCYYCVHPCCRELKQLLKAWEAMRLGKDAQIAALIERCKRHEEDAMEKARTVEALRRKLAAVARLEATGMF